MAIAYQRILKGYDFNQSPSSEYNKNFIKYFTDYEGCCVKSYTKNDDVCMVVFIKESNTFKVINYASTYCNTYAKEHSFVDAPDQIKEKYDAYCVTKKRSRKAFELLELRRSEHLAVSKFKISIKNLRRILSNHGAMYYNTCLKILNSIIRGNTKKNLRNTLLNFINGVSETLTPFSYGQWCLAKELFN